jgi:chemotaxis protein histidine kinase CheA
MSLMIAEHVSLAQLDDLDDLGQGWGDLIAGGIALYGAHQNAKIAKAAEKRAKAIDNKKMQLLDKKHALDAMLANLQADGTKAMNSAQMRQAEIQLKVQQARADVEIAKLEQEQALNAIRGEAIESQLRENIRRGMPMAQAEAIAVKQIETGQEPSDSGVVTTDNGEILGMKPLVFAGVAGGGALLLLTGLYFVVRK